MLFSLFKKYALPCSFRGSKENKQGLRKTQKYIIVGDAFNAKAISSTADTSTELVKLILFITTIWVVIKVVKQACSGDDLTSLPKN